MNTADLLGSRGLLTSGMAAIADAVNTWARSKDEERREKRRQDLMLREEERQAKLDAAQENNRRLQILLQTGIDISEPDYLDQVKALKAAEREKQQGEEQEKNTRRMADLILATGGAADPRSEDFLDQVSAWAQLQEGLKAEKEAERFEKPETARVAKSEGKKEKPGDALKGIGETAKTFDLEPKDGDYDSAAKQKMLDNLRKIKKYGGTLSANQEAALQYLEVWEQEQEEKANEVGNGSDGKPGVFGKAFNKLTENIPQIAQGGLVKQFTWDPFIKPLYKAPIKDYGKMVVEVPKHAVKNAATLKVLPSPFAKKTTEQAVKKGAIQAIKSGAGAVARGVGTVASKAAIPVSLALGIADVARYYGGDGETVSGTPELLAALLSAEGPDDRLKWVRGEQVPEYSLWAHAVRSGVPMDKPYKTDFDRAVQKIDSESRDPEVRLVRLEDLIQKLKKKAGSK